MHPLVNDIKAGNFDDILGELEEAVKERRAGSRLAELGFAIGDRCNFVHNVSPQYLNKHGVEVVDVKGSGALVVKALAPRAHGRRFRVWARDLEKVAA